jgi:DNA-binding NtrC family response regulator
MAMSEPCFARSGAASAVPDLDLYGDPAAEPCALIVDDDLDLRGAFAVALRRVDPALRLDWATSVRGAIEQLAKRPYEFVVADYLLDDGVGIEVKRWVDRFEPGLPFAIVSVFPFSQEIVRRGGRAVPFLAKPFAIQELHELLAKLRESARFR